MKHLFFMRHGLSVMNKRGIFSGRNNNPLAREGERQCKEAAKQLKNIAVDAIVCSPMKRAVDSARIVAKEIGFPEDKIIINDLFMERGFGELEGTIYAHGLDLDSHHGVEQTQAIIERAQRGLEFINNLSADTVLIVSHGAVGHALRHILKPEVSYQETKGLTNAEIVKLI